jgi:hypothetical protein
MEAAPLGWAKELFSSFTCCEPGSCKTGSKKRVITQPFELVIRPLAGLPASAVASAAQAAKDSAPVATMDRRGSFSDKDVDHAKQALSKAREKMEHAHIKLDRSNEVTRQLSQQLTQVRGLQGRRGCFHQGSLFGVSCDASRDDAPQI